MQDISRVKDTTITLAVAADLGAKAIAEVVGGSLSQSIGGNQATAGLLKTILIAAIRSKLKTKGA
jgi:hypothetical protein